MFTRQRTKENAFYIFPLIIIVGFGVQNLLTLSTSNFPYLNYAVAFLLSAILVQLFTLMKANFRALLIGNVVLLIFIYFNLNQVYKSIYYFHPNGLLGTKAMTEKSRFKALGISRNYKTNGDDFQYCINLLDSVYKVKKAPLFIANFTSLPVEMQVPSKRISGLPLWPDNNVLLFNREKKRYLNLLEKKQFDLIFILELDFSGYNFTNKVFKEEAFENYKIAKRFGLTYYNGSRQIVVLEKKTHQIE